MVTNAGTFLLLPTLFCASAAFKTGQIFYFADFIDTAACIAQKIIADVTFAVCNTDKFGLHQCNGQGNLFQKLSVFVIDLNAVTPVAQTQKVIAVNLHALLCVALSAAVFKAFDELEL